MQPALAEGRRLTGRKIGLTSLAVQKQLGVDQPDYGMLFADMELLDDAAVSPNALIQPKVELEMAFILRAGIPREDATVSEMLSAIGIDPDLWTPRTLSRKVSSC